jgi:tetratricopeptide (TPR) repeat protein
LITKLPGIPLFTLNPPHGAGRRARKGFEFQDRYAAYILSGFGVGSDQLVVARIEAVEDIDVLAIVDGLPVERYYQVKSKDEGSGHWTLRQLEDLGVLDRFFSLYKLFERKKREQDRRIELFLSVEGDLNRELLDLKQQAWEATECRNHLLAWLCLVELLAADGGSQYQTGDGGIRKLYEAEAANYLSDSQCRLPKDEEPPQVIRELAERSGGSAQDVIEDLNRAAGRVLPFFKDFIASLRFDSRLASLEERTHVRLLGRGDMSPDEARAAMESLLRAIRDESLLPEPTDISPAVLSAWVGSPEREMLQSKPELPPEAVQRGGLLHELTTRLETETALLLHGLPKVGKSQLISALIDSSGKTQDYFWFTFSGERNETGTLARQLATWFGRRTGVWQIKDDVYAGLLQPTQVISRLGGVPLRDAWVILDDCHRLQDRAILGALRTLIDQAWAGSRLILASEEKLPEVSALGITQVLVHGFEPKESLEFVCRLGLDVSSAIIEFAMLAVRVDGHPLMLRAAVSELPRRPSPAEMSAVAQRLPSVEPVKGFLDGLSNAIFFGLVRTQEQRGWLRRMAVLTASFTRSLAFSLAALQPSIEVGDADWRCLSSLVLDQTGADRYSVPPLIRQLAVSDVARPLARTILVATARDIFNAAFATHEIDFQDFHSAIISLILADAVEEAATRLIFSFPSFATSESFEPFELLFLVLNGEPIHAKLPDPGTRWMLLKLEVCARLRDPAAAKDSKIASLLARMRLIFHEEWKPARRKLYSRVMHHLTSCFARFQRAASAPPQPERSQKLLAPVESALRLALTSGDQEQILMVLHVYEQVHNIPARHPDVETLKQALLSVHTQEVAISAEGLVSVYEQFVLHARDLDKAVHLLRKHSKQYLDAGLNEAHFACVHAEGTALLSRFQQPQQARELIERVGLTATGLGLSAHCVGRAELLVADTFWAEGDYAKAGRHYERGLRVEYSDPWVEQYITERLCDSWISLGNYKEATALLVRSLRSRRSNLPHEAITQFYARLAYAFTLASEFKKAAISCEALCRTAERAQSDELRSRAVKVVAWALGHVDPSDPAVVPDAVEIANSSALSERCPPEQVDKLREIDPARSTGTFLTAMIFEFAGDLRRSEALLRKALRAVEVTHGSTLVCLAQSCAYGLRACRVQIKRGRLADAAGSFKKAFSSSVEMARRREVETAADGPVAAGLWDRVATATQKCAEADLVVLFDSLCAEFPDNQAAIAWLRFRKGKMLFERGSVQSAKRRVLEAERLAQEESDKVLIAEIIYEKLFNRIDEFYSSRGSRAAWLADALDATLLMAGDVAFNGVREPFANNIRAISRHQAGPPFDRLNVTTARFEGLMNDHGFLVVAYAMWHAATKHRLIVGSLNSLEVYLRQNATFLSEDDFH